MKRVFIALLFVFIILCVLVNAKQVGSGVFGDNLTCVIEDDGTMIISGTGEMYQAHSTTNNLFVKRIIVEEGATNIGKFAFSSYYLLKSVKLPSTLISIDDHAFQFCEQLAEIEIPESVTSIGRDAFFMCGNLKRIYYTGSAESFEKINISREGYGNNNLFHKNVEIIYNSSMPDENDESSKQVETQEKNDDKNDEKSDSLNEYDIDFDNLEISLVNALDPKGYCGENLTYEIDDAGTLTVSGTGEMTDYGFVNGSSFAYEFLTRDVKERVKKIVVEEGATSIGDYVFQSFPNLVSVEIADSVETIGWKAFFECDRLERVKLPKNLISIGNSAFYGCGALLYIELPEGLKTIEECAFCDCDAIKELKLPNGILMVGNDAFGSCDGLQAVYYDGSEDDWSKIVGYYNDTFENINMVFKYDEEAADVMNEKAVDDKVEESGTKVEEKEINEEIVEKTDTQNSSNNMLIIVLIICITAIVLALILLAVLIVLKKK